MFVHATRIKTLTRKVLHGTLIGAALMAFVAFTLPVSVYEWAPQLAVAEAACNTGETGTACGTRIAGEATSSCGSNATCQQNYVQSNCGGNTECTATAQQTLNSLAGSSTSAEDPASGLGWFGQQLYGAVIVIINVILAAIVALISSILALVGTGFDFAVNHSIIQFATNYDKFFATGVNKAWGGFRDIANIIMIAMFIFVAFAVILNSETYGIKRFGVRILMVAVLINFSLFFTKVIIDASNITASQFRSAIVIQNTSTNKPGGITEAIMQRAGLTAFSYSAAYSALDSVSGKGKDLSLGNSFLYAFLVIVFSGSLIVIFLYGLILLATRSVAFLVLMITSAMAFAIFLVPKYGDQWWHKWWDTLIKNALFAPLLMLMLWAVVNLIQGLGGPGSVGTGILTQMVKNSANSGESGWAPVFNMMLIVGLVYASIKIANELSIAGGSFAQKWSMKGLRGALRGSGLGVLSGLAGRLGRTYIGATAKSWSEDPALRQRAVTGNWAQRMNARAQLAGTRALAKASFDFRDSKIAKNLEKNTGVSIGTKGVGGYEDYQKKELERVTDAAKAAGEAAKATADEVRESAGTAPLTTGGGSGEAEKIAASIKEAAEKNNQANQKAINTAVGAQRQANTSQALDDASTGDNKGDETAGAASKGQQEKNTLAKQDTEISSLASDIQAKERNRLRDVINVRTQDIPTARIEGNVNVRGGTVSSPDVVEAIQGLRADLQRGQQSSNESSKSSKDIAADASKAFLERYREQSGITRDRRSIRDRIYKQASGEFKKTDDEKAKDKIESRMKKLEDSQKSEDA